MGDTNVPANPFLESSVNLPNGIDRVKADIAADHASLDGHKKERHIAYLKAFAASKGKTMSDSELDSFSQLNGVTERSTEELAAARYILEPMGVKPQNWSMSVGKNIASVGYTFADYFPIVKYWLGDDWDALKAQNGGDEQKTCDYVHKQSMAAFSGNGANGADGPAPATAIGEDKALDDVRKACLAGALKPTATLAATGKSAMKTCIACHAENEDAKAAFNFNIPANVSMKDWLNGGTGTKTRAMKILKAIKSGEMPPGDFDEGDWKANMGSLTSTAHGNVYAKKVLFNYVSREANGDNTALPIDCDYFAQPKANNAERTH